MNACLICLDPSESEVHAECSRRLFGVSVPPSIDLKLANLHTVALAMVGRTSLSGVQRKISANISSDRKTLQLATEAGRYILKPDSQAYPDLPANEHVTMMIARSARIAVPGFGLVRLADGSLAYIVTRFDRPIDGGKLRQEDFCQLGELPPKDKYEGSAEACVKILRRYASEPLVDIAKLFRRLVFSWWTGNGDMHRKNFSLLTLQDGTHVLSPAYDLVCTRLLIEDDQLALPVCGKRARISRQTWLEFADYAGIPRRAAKRIISEIVASTQQATSLVGRSYLRADMRDAYAAFLRDRASLLRG